MPNFLNGLFFSELLVDNAGGGAVNVNGQGGANKQDEFIEIQNNSGATVNLSGYQIWSDKNGLLHTFGTGNQVASGGTATVVGSYNNPPAGFFGANGNNNSSSQGGGFLEDGEGSKFDTIYLVAPNGDYIQLSYGEPPQDPGGLPTGFPTGGSRQGTGEELNTNAPNATSITRDADGNLTEGTPTAGTSGPVCFVSGTRILTPSGEVPIENLAVGDKVLTLDQGSQHIRWIARTKLSASDLEANQKWRPVRIRAGALGNGLPETDLMVSPQHRILVKSAIVHRMFNVHEVLVPAIKIIDLDGIDIVEEAQGIEYWHILFEAHQIIWSNGAPTESLFTGPEALKAVSPALRMEIAALFPELAKPQSRQKAARLLPAKGKAIKELTARHLKNSKPMVEL